jgi:hypothetical protein
MAPRCMWILASLNSSLKASCVPRQDNEDNCDWDYGGRGGTVWAGLQPFFADETDDLEATLQPIDESLKLSRSLLSTSGALTHCLRGRGCAARIENWDSSSIIQLPLSLTPARAIATCTMGASQFLPVSLHPYSTSGYPYARGPGGHNLARKPGHDGSLDLLASSPHSMDASVAWTVVLLRTMRLDSAFAYIASMMKLWATIHGISFPVTNSLSVFAQPACCFRPSVNHWSQ